MEIPQNYHQLMERAGTALETAKIVARMVSAAPLILIGGCGYVEGPRGKLEYHDHGNFYGFVPNPHVVINGSLPSIYIPEKHGDLTCFVKVGEIIPGAPQSPDGRDPVHRHINETAIDGLFGPWEFRYE